MSTPHASPPSVDDIFRYRYQHGTNVGPIFMHGPWLDNNAFETDLNSTRELEEIKRLVADDSSFSRFDPTDASHTVRLRQKGLTKLDRTGSLTGGQH
jgi:hypothetical protein